MSLLVSARLLVPIGMSVLFIPVAGSPAVQPVMAVDGHSSRVVFPAVRDPGSIRIRLDRSTCYGPCPDYSVEIRGDGQVLYEGRSGILATTGHHRDRISKDRVGFLFDAFRRADFLFCKDQYDVRNRDSPTNQVSLEFDGIAKTVVDHEGSSVGLPKAVAQLEQLIDAEAHTDKWLHLTADTIPSLLREHWRFQEASPDNYALFALAAARDDFLQLYLEHGFPRFRRGRDCR